MIDRDGMRWGRTALLIFVAVGCDVVIGIEDLPVGSGEPLGYASPACQACVREVCAPQEAGCLLDATCRELHNCLAACQIDDPACRQQCEQIWPGITDVRGGELDACRRRECTVACLGSRRLGEHTADAACSACVDEACVVQAQACVRSDRPESPEFGARPGHCERQLQCMTHTRDIDPDRVRDCYARFAGGSSLVEQFGLCAISQCDCPYAREWSCVGSYDWALLATSLATEFTVEALPGATVRACSLIACESCSVLVDEALVGPAEQVVLTLPSAGGNVRVCFHTELDGYLKTITVPGRPLNRPNQRIQTQLGTTEGAMGFAEEAGIAYDPSRGNLVVLVRDCWNAFAPGIRVDASTADAKTVRGYVGSMGFDAEATETAIEGAMGFLNVPPGEVELVAYRDDVEVSRHRAPVVANTVTYVHMNPSVREQ